MCTLESIEQMSMLRKIHWALWLLILGCAQVACGPIRPAPAPSAPDRPFEVHTCVSQAVVWVDGAGLPDPVKIQADANGIAAMPPLPFSVSAFNLHATAPGYPEYGEVMHPLPSSERLAVYLKGCNR